MKIGHHCAIYAGAEIRAPWRISIGNFVSIGGRVVLDGRGGLQIHACVNISSEVMLWTAQHDYRRADFAASVAPIVLEEYVWLGPRVIVLPGVTVARGCVIAAGAVVTRSTKPFGIYVGVPATRVGERPIELDYHPGYNYTPII